MNKKIKLQIRNIKDRNDIAIILALNYYKIWFEEESTGTSKIYYIIFEIKEDDS